MDFVISAPLLAAVDTQKHAAENTKKLILSMIKNKKPITIDFNVERKETSANGTEQTKTLNIHAPLLSIVPIPHLRIDLLTVHFKYEISQVTTTTEDSSSGGGGEVGGVLSWIGFSLGGNISSSSSTTSTANRNGVLEINVHASESVIPEGLAKILNILSNSIQSLPVTT